MDKYIIEGLFKPYDDKDFELDISVTLHGINIKSFSKNLLMKKLVQLSDEHGIYILESNGCAYIGQSKNIQNRIKNHQGKNKIDFQRCFILSKYEGDWRQYLDYMEAYTIFEMESRGYKLENSKKPDHNKDKLNAYKKELASQWVNVFLSFLPMMGFGSFIEKESKEDVEKVEVNKLSINKVEKKLKVNNVLLTANTWKELLRNLIIEVGVEKIFRANILNSRGSIFLTNIEQESRLSLRLLEDNDNKYYLGINASQEKIKNYVKRIEKKLGLTIEVLE